MDKINKEVFIFSGLVHAIAGIVIWIYFPSLNLIVLLLGCLFPDSDKKNTAMGKILPLWIFFKHRGATHRIWFAIVVALLLSYVFNNNIGLSFFIGHVSHVILDTITPRGRKKLFKRRK
jgi:inner membrane protein